MVKKSGINDEERDEFRQAMKRVKRLKSDKRDTTRPPPYKKTSKPTQQQPSTANIPYSHPGDEFSRESDWQAGEEIIQFCRSGVQKRRLDQLKRGKLPIEAQLDLHRMTASEALSATDYFINQASEQQIRCVLIIHGKGHYSNSFAPVLKNVLNQWLRKHSKVLAFNSAQARHGGTGAVYVLLKKCAS